MVIYKVTNLINGKIYIGQTIRFEKRKLRHFYDAFNENSQVVFHRALRKYGFDNFKWEVIDMAETHEELSEKETYWINFYKSYINFENSNGYNQTLGGEGMAGFSHSEETKQRLSIAHTGKKLSDETKRKVGIASKGRVYTEEAKKKISETHQGIKHHNAKLTEEDVLQIKELIKNGLLQTTIGKMFNISTSIINNIKQGRGWKHIGEDISEIKTKERKLNEDNVLEIKKLLKSGTSQKEIAIKFNVSPSTISEIKSGKKWAKIGEDISNIKKFNKPNAKLNEEKVKKIKKLLSQGITQKEIAELFNINVAIISRIKLGKAWKYVEGN